MGLESFAELELRKVGLYDEDSDYGGMLAEAVIELVRAFAAQGHSGFSAAQTIKIFSKVADYEPLGPLTGDDDEWNEISERRGGKCWQNKRCSHVFKDETGAYDINGRVFFRGSSGACFTTMPASRVAVTFPYTPHTKYVKVGMIYHLKEMASNLWLRLRRGLRG